METQKVMSMTGFGRAQFKGENFKLVVTIKSVNGKGLDVNFKTPKELMVYEKELRRFIKSAVHRGQVYVHIGLEIFKVKPTIKLSDLTEIVDELLSSTRKLGLSVSDDLILQLALRFYNPAADEEENFLESEDFKEVLFNTFGKALRDFLESKLEEGKNLLRDIQKNLEELEGYLEQVERKKDEIMENYRRKLIEKAKEILGEEVQKNQLVVNELKLLFEKLDINEEIERLKSHIQLFKEELQKGAPIGKKLEFITQEMLREINTMGNKLPDLFPLNIEMKTAVDKLRQQVANIE